MYKWILFLIFLSLTACKPAPKRFNGYIDADLLYLSSNYPGRLESLAVHRGEPVQKGQLLFRLEQKNERYAKKTNESSTTNLVATKKALQDQLKFATSNYERIQTMQKHHAASLTDLDIATKDCDVLKNQLAGIEAQIQGGSAQTDAIQWQIDRKIGVATRDGLIFDTYFNPGEYVQMGQPVVALLAKDFIKVMFFVSEPNLSQIRLNQKIKISSDLAPNLAEGSIQYISQVAQYTPPIIYSKEDRADLVFRVEARIDAPNLNQLHLGMPITLELME